ncbi:MAG: hypothetical protein HY319_27285 [Armatimonadetes bacterium]|nr:hypothetical protein [Armatimonadota bacterium]
MKLKTKTDKLMTALAEVGEEERVLVELLSLFYLPVGATSLRQALRRYGVEEDPEPLLERLVQQELVVRHGSAYRCAPGIVEEASQGSVSAGRFEKLYRALPHKSALSSELEDYPEGVRDLRLALYAGDRLEFCRRLANLVKRYPNDYNRDLPLTRIACGHRETGWLERLDDTLRSLLVQGVMLKGSQHLLPGGSVVQWLQKQSSQPGDSVPRLHRQLYLQHLMFSDRLDEVKRELKKGPPLPGITGWVELEHGRHKKALALFEEALDLAHRETPENAKLTGYANYLLAVLQIRAGKLQEAGQHLKGSRGLDYEALTWLLEVKEQGRVETPEWLVRFRQQDPSLDGQDTLGAVLALYWAGLEEEARDFGERIQKLAARAAENGHAWVKRQLLALVARLEGKEESSSDRVPLVNALEPEEAWRRTIEALQGVALEARPDSDGRVAWRVEEVDGQYSVRPLLQKRSKKGDWTGGKELLPHRILNQHGDCLLEQDRGALRTLVHGLDSYRVGDESTLAELVGHPYVFWEQQPEIRVDIQKGSPEIRVLQQGDRMAVDVQPVLPYMTADVGVLPEGPHRLRIYRFTEAQKKIANLVGKGVNVPVESCEELHKTVELLSPLIGVQSDLTQGFAGAKEVPGDPSPHLLLIPMAEGLRLELRVRPLGEDGAVFPPGHGGRMVVAEREGRRVQAQRDPEEELRRGIQVLERCTSLTRYGPGGWNWALPTPSDCLEVLEELGQLPEGMLTLHWPEGQAYSISRPRGPLRLSIRKERDWFAVDGRIQVDEELVMDVGDLLDRLQHAAGRFIPLGEGRFLTLTDHFRKRLEQLADLRQGQGGELRLDPLAAATVFEGDPEVEGDQDWSDFLKKFREAWEYRPQVPSTMQADLRDYQEDGYRWLARLAHLGVGACLADDMGLGKTLQALAIILARAAQGPTLVLAPTSVCSNWADETRKFAPSLRPLLFAESDRQQVIRELAPFDLLICSYGLLAREAELLGGPTWTTLVADEAQQIKNSQTRRFKATAALKADFRITTTGTPVENNLDELWSLFRFLNPGLLGSRERFSTRFVQPMEEGDRRARTRLRELVRPFILRRTKSEVLDELPPRTEITLHVEMSDEEKALYENLRRRALERLEAAEEREPLAVLAELSRLRRACCHPRLVAPEESIPASKLETFQELVTELLEAGHKALIFSQFVDVLTILREHLDQAGVSYQYLDGGTPAKERARRVAAFQNGEGDLFLISLRAGGVGLNLTAADYVIHYDPWWNPAVEDQASDRAYRIGQTRPVTIYRLITRGTVEDKIVELHKSKRELAAELLDGSDRVGRLSSEELLDLIRGAAVETLQA